MKRLGDFAYVGAGYTYRGSLKYAHEGDTAIIQSADATNEALAMPELFARLNLRKIGDHYFLHEGDLVMRARGAHYSAYLISNPLERTICIAPLLYLRVKDSGKILPAYLHWFLNLITVQEILKGAARTGAGGMQYIGIRDITELAIPIPSVQRQQDIVSHYLNEKADYGKLAQINMSRLRRFEQWLLTESE